jgi:hypothetical protein
MIIHNPILTGSFTVNGTDVSSITSSAASLTSLNSYTASQNNRNGTYATTGSNTFAGIQTVNSNLVVTGSITAQTLVVQTVTSSVVYSSGSNVFGNNIANTQVFTGSMNLTGSLTVVTTGTEFQVNANGVKFGNVIGDAHNITGSVGISGSLSGTSATFSGNVNTTNGILTIKTAAYGGLLQLESGTSTDKWLMYHYSPDNSFRMNYNGSGNDELTIASTGAATFSSTISAGVITGDSNSTGTPSIVAKVGSGGNNGTFGFGNNSNYRIRGGSDYGAMIFDTAGAEFMRITSDGLVRINKNLQLDDNQLNTPKYIVYSANVNSGASGTLGSIHWLNTQWDNQKKAEIVALTDTDITNGRLSFRTGTSGVDATEKMRITSAGFTKASNYGGYFGATLSYHEFGTNSSGNWNTIMFNTSAGPYGLYIPYTTASPNNTGNEYLYLTDSSTVRFSVRSNGGITNFQANDVNLSDERTKKDIIPLESYWDKFKAIEIVKFKYKDQTHDDFNIGVIAQQVEAVAPEFVDVDGWEKPELDEDGNEIVSDEEPLKSIYTADLHHATIKVLQEAMAKIETLEAQINELKNK